MNSLADNFSNFETLFDPDQRTGKIPTFIRDLLMKKCAGLSGWRDRELSHGKDRHSSAIFAVILVIILFGILDAIFTLDLVSHGAVELNPIMGYYLNHSPIVFFLVKYFLTCASILLLLVNKNVYLFKTRIQAKTLLVLFLIPLALVIQWELYLILKYVQH